MIWLQIRGARGQLQPLKFQISLDCWQCQLGFPLWFCENFGSRWHVLWTCVLINYSETWKLLVIVALNYLGGCDNMKLCKGKAMVTQNSDAYVCLKKWTRHEDWKKLPSTQNADAYKNRHKNEQNSCWYFSFFFFTT